MLKFKLFIMAAGIGSRNTYYPGLHKALLPVENIPAISRIINNVAPNVEIVVAVGYKKEQLISYLQFAHPDRKFTWVEQNPYHGEGVGPAHAVLAAQDHLQCPFIISTCDTVISSKVEHSCPTENWIGVDKSSAVEYACYKNGTLQREIVPPIYIGVAGVADWQSYLSILEHTQTKENTTGFTNYKLVPFNWMDTGSNATYELLDHSTIVPPKDDQAVFIVGKKVVKFWSDSTIAENVWKVATRLGANVEKLNDNMIGYDYIDGTLFSDVTHNVEEVTTKVLDFIRTDGVPKPDNFAELCHEMYEAKTRSRVKQFLEKYPEVDNIKYVNGVSVESIDLYLDKINWKEINETSVASTKYHGDVQPENIIVTPTGDISFIDWRASFGGNTEIGDMYYDLGKLWHDLLVSHQNVLAKKYTVNISENPHGEKVADISIELKDNLIKALKVLPVYCRDNGLDDRKVSQLGAIQYMTIACLYPDPKFATFLFLLSKLCLALWPLQNATDHLLNSIKMKNNNTSEQLAHG